MVAGLRAMARAAIVVAHLAVVSPGGAQGVLGVSDETGVDGEVAEMFGTRFVIASERGRILVDPPGLDRALPIGPGDRLSVTGSLADRTLFAHRVVRADGTVLLPSAGGTTASAPLPDRTAIIDDALRALQLTPLGQPVRKKRHTEVMARMQDGRTVYVSLNRLGRVVEIEDAGHDKGAARPARSLTPDDYREIVRRAGFQPLDDFETKKHHIELLTRNRAGELVELHLDRAGYIYKQIWVR